MKLARIVFTATVALCVGCAELRIEPAHALASSPVHYELRENFATEPIFESNVPPGDAQPGSRRLRVSCRLAWIDDRRAEELFPGSETGLVALALAPDEGRRLVAALTSEDVPSAEAREGERTELSSLDDDEYVVGWDIDVAGGQKTEKSVVKKSGGGTKVHLIARPDGAGALNVDAAFTWLFKEIGIAFADLPPDRVGVDLSPPVIVGQRVRAQLSVPVGGTLVLGGFRLVDMPSPQGRHGWIFRSLSTTLFAFVTIESLDSSA